MDKYEYQVCADQIKLLISERRYVDAMNIADTIDWRRVKSVSMLCTVSEIYKINKRYEESMDILLLAYDRYPNGRTIVYALCELAIKLNDVVQAVEFYKEFVHLAPEDTSNYILLYKIYEAQEVSLEERIEVLEEFKKRDYREKWAYELAYLYHKTGQETRCIQECDELILWFGDGKYVKKAMELKMEHTRLTREQQMKYEGRQEPITDQFGFSQGMPVQQIYDTDPQAGNLQQIPFQPYSQTGQYENPMQMQPMTVQEEPVSILNTTEINSIEVRPINVGMYNTMDLQNGLSENIKQFFENEQTDVDENVKFSGNPDAYNNLYEKDTMGMSASMTSEGPVIHIDGEAEEGYEEQIDAAEPDVEDEDIQITQYMPTSNEIREISEVEDTEAETVDEEAVEEVEDNAEIETEEINEEDLIRAHDEAPVSIDMESEAEEEMTTTSTNPVKYDEMLKQEYDGQISMSIEPQPQVDKQITGQIELEDIIIGWEEKRRENEQRRIEEAKKKSLLQTSDIMAQLKGVLPEIDDIARPTPPRPLPPIDREAVLRVQATGSMPVEEFAKIPEDMSDELMDQAVMEAIAKHDDSIEQEDIEESTAQYEDILSNYADEEVSENKEEDLEAAEEALPYVAEETEEEESLEAEQEPDVEEFSETEDEYKEEDSIESEEEPGVEEYPELEEESWVEELPEPEEDLEEEEPIENGEDSEVEESAEEEDSEAEVPLENEEEPDKEEILESSEESEDESEEEELPKIEIYGETDIEVPEIAIDEIAEEPDKDVEESEAEEALEEDFSLSYQVDEEAAKRAAMEVTSELPRYPYEELDDYGEVEELETIEQPEEIDGLMETRDLPVDAIAQANYEAGIEEDYSSEYDDLDIEPQVKKHPSYMKLDKTPVVKREFDKEEEKIFGRFNDIKWLKAQIVNAVDNMSMESSKGNVIVMGSEASGRRDIAINIVKTMQSLDDGFKGKVAKISGEALNKKDIPVTIKKLKNGALIVEDAESLTPSSARLIAEALELETESVLVVLEGSKEGIESLIDSSKAVMNRVFDARIDLQEYTTDDLVAYGKGYAREQEYAIDEMGILALYTKIGDMQTLDHEVSLEEVRDIIDNAIKHVDKKNMSHFMDVLFAKRYDDKDFIILREKDFMS